MTVTVTKTVLVTLDNRKLTSGIRKPTLEFNWIIGNQTSTMDSQHQTIEEKNLHLKTDCRQWKPTLTIKQRLWKI